MPAVAGARQDMQVRKGAARHFHHLQRLLHVFHRYHQHAGALGAGGAQQVGATRIAEIDLGAEPPHHLDLAGVALQRGKTDALHAQHPADDLPKATETGDNHRCAVVRDRVVGRRFAAAERGDQHRLAGGEQQRRGNHGERHHQRGRLGGLGGQRADPDRRGEHDEGELAALRQGHRKAQHIGGAAPRQQAKHEHQRDLHREQHRHGGQHADRVLREQGKPRRHADRNEEEPEQQPFERLDVGLQFVAVLAVGQQHASEEGAERR